MSTNIMYILEMLIYRGDSPLYLVSVLYCCMHIVVFSCQLLGSSVCGFSFQAFLCLRHYVKYYSNCHPLLNAMSVTFTTSGLVAVGSVFVSNKGSFSLDEDNICPCLGNFKAKIPIIGTRIIYD